MKLVQQFWEEKTPFFALSAKRTSGAQLAYKELTDVRPE